MSRKILTMAAIGGLVLATTACAEPWDKVKSGVKTGAVKAVNSDIAQKVASNASKSSSSSSSDADSKLMNAYAQTIIHRQYAILKLADALQIKGLAQEKKDVAVKLGEANGYFDADDIPGLVATSSNTMRKVSAKLDEVKELAETQKQHAADAMGLFERSLQAEAEKSAELKKFIGKYVANIGAGAVTRGVSAGTAVGVGADALGRRKKYRDLAQKMDALGAETLSLQAKVNAVAVRNSITANPVNRLPSASEMRFEDDED
ncbi:hypothetical protein FACS1894139_05880 [Planctomycetales bacterium]|nr:hypothetical protein FACS1894107_05300 [Planctomycetales bacterium]GHS97603.1 hypothetical protein FACS1894108_04270 [Planctomycetales bacterium]GHT04173.1 hypothetical protein FACS1894139_05880 [Planctomycetales bacterium]